MSHALPYSELSSAAHLDCLLQFSHSSNNPRDDIATEAYEDELDMGRSGSYLNSSINSAWSEHSLDPEDIRVRPAGQLSNFRGDPLQMCVHVHYRGCVMVCDNKCKVNPHPEHINSTSECLNSISSWANLRSFD